MTLRGYADWARFIEHKIERILGSSGSSKTRMGPPVDLESLRKDFRVVAMETRPMIPEAATEVTNGGFKIYLQSNFADLPETTSRRRFTLAHEFCHTLFFDDCAEVPKRIDGAPTRDTLEKLCHKGAGLLLVPAALLRSETKALKEITSKDIPTLARRFAVSVEVILRRLQEMEDFSAVDRAIILAGRLRGVPGPHVLAAYYGPWILPYFDPPKYGAQLDRWLNGVADMRAILASEGFQVQVPEGNLLGSSPIFLSQNRFLFDIHLRPGPTGRLGNP
jgi:hypothetical protein